MSVIEFVRAVAFTHGLLIDERAADAVLWECTGYPAFWSGDASPIQCLRRQLDTAFASLPREASPRSSYELVGPALARAEREMAEAMAAYEAAHPEV